MSDWNLLPSTHSSLTDNPVMDLISSINLPLDFAVPTYSLALGDPTHYSDFAAIPLVVESVQQKLLEGRGNGYTDSFGSYESRECLAEYFSYENIQLDISDVVIDIGGVGAIHSILQIFLNPGDNLLIPSPGFPLYQSMAKNLSAEAFCYKLKPEKGWEIDFDDLDSKVNARTKLLVIVNPSNPCGSVFSKEHLLDILKWASRNKVCILADEVYHNMTFGKQHFPLGSLTDDVPVFTVGALSKMFLVPGWRCGWILIYDKYKKCLKLKDSLRKIKNMLLHPAPFIMQAIPNILKNLPQDYFQSLMQKVKLRADIVKNVLGQVKALGVGEPEGSLYCMVSVDFQRLNIQSSVEFARALANEQGVLVMPAEAFLSTNGFRIVLCHPLHVIEECMLRIKNFIENHTVEN